MLLEQTGTERQNAKRTGAESHGIVPEPHSEYLHSVLIRSAHSFAERRGHELPGVIYFIQCGEGGPIKIGYTKALGARLSELKAFAPEALKVLAAVPGDHRFERHYHFTFEDDRTQGEWFRPSPRLLAEVAYLRERWGEPVLGKANRRRPKTPQKSAVSSASVGKTDTSPSSENHIDGKTLSAASGMQKECRKAAE